LAPHRELAFEGVSFHYLPGEPVLHKIDLRIPFGEKLAIVGANGCGKSTLVNLVARFYDPVEGAVRMDGVDLRQCRVRELRRKIGIVTQQTVLFDDTVMNNIRYGSLHATDEQVIAAAKKAHAHRFITEKLDEGYDTIVGERGGRLSGGQRQRIALARAILRDPEILVLDEATSQIDLESEQLIHQALRDFARGRTAILITHRLSTLTLADRILVMDAGRVADLGTHHELLTRCEIYRRLHQIQFRESA
jgi:ATP-binding cassette subfamily B protein/subfamily B ATP-binding cassette protein MsbA